MSDIFGIRIQFVMLLGTWHDPFILVKEINSTKQKQNKIIIQKIILETRLMKN